LARQFEVPDATTVICGYALCNCARIPRVHFGGASALAKIESFAFFATTIREIEIPPLVTEIGESAFGDCARLAVVNFRSGSQLAKIGAEAFRRSGIERFIGPPLLAELGEGVFAYCAKLKTAVLPPNVRNLPVDTFLDCFALEVVRADAPPGERPFKVRLPAFPTRFHKRYFRHHEDLSIKEITPDWMRDAPDTTEYYERKLPPGTPPEQLLIDDGDRVQIGDMLSHTSIGQTYKARNVLTGEISLVKEFIDANEAALNNEREIISRLVHPAILGTIGIVVPGPDSPAKLITEFLPHGSLEALIRIHERYEALSATAKVKIGIGIVLAMRYIHSCNIFHRDLKPSNVLLDENDEIRISDFHLARVVDLPTATMTNSFKAHFYMAPDMAEDHYDNSVDVYAFAMIFWELLSGKHILETLPEKKDPGPLNMMKLAKSGSWRPPLEDLEDLARDLLDRCWATDATQRPSFEAIFRELKQSNYALLPGVIVEEIDQYVESILRYEEENPPLELQQWVPDDD
jgi:hypothetical protein